MWCVRREEDDRDDRSLHGVEMIAMTALSNAV